MAMRYVELNPVRAGLCNKPQDWPWSSARGNLGLTPDPLVDRRHTKDIITDWHKYLGAKELSEELNHLRMQTVSGRPEGSAAFVEKLEVLTGRQIRKKRPGRKRK